MATLAEENYVVVPENLSLWRHKPNRVYNIQERGATMNNYKYNASVFKAFCDESRLCIIEQLQHSEMCACNLLEELPISQSTLSHHMKILIESGVVESRKEGKWVYYALSEVGTKRAIALLNGITALDEDYISNGSC
jgi:ArsR family transcriptional regulator